MKSLTRIVATASFAAVLTGALAAPALADSRHSDHSVFVQTDAVSGNQVIAYDRADDGTLTFAHAYATSGNGGALAGSVVDHLASQGSLTLDTEHDALYTVNAGSNTISVFSVDGDRLRLREVVPSGGDFPVSIAVHDDVAYVLNARNGGSVSGYRTRFGLLDPIPGSTRALGLDPNATPEFTSTPGQVGFSPEGDQLIVTTKGSGNSVDVFRVSEDGRLSAPVVNSLPGTVPFAFDFDPSGNLVVTEAGPNALASFDLRHDGTIKLLASVPTAQAATCWIVDAGRSFYASNAGSGSLSQVDSGHRGSLAFIGNTHTDGGTVDAAVTADERFLYVQTGAAGNVDEFRVNSDSSLSPIGTVTVPDAVGGEGIVAI
jgi:6-phosphogluconolactonase (cycloisomerase 2 family)